MQMLPAHGETRWKSAAPAVHTARLKTTEDQRLDQHAWLQADRKGAAVFGEALDLQHSSWCLSVLPLPEGFDGGEGSKA